MNPTAQKDDFLAVYHILKFSKSGKDELEVADIERRCLATKYSTAKQCESQELGASLLRNGLKEYQIVMENKDGVNNYWKQIKAQSQKTSNDPRKWTSALHDTSVALNFLKPLPCKSNNTRACQAKVISDKHVESVIWLWGNTDSSTRIRKVSGQGKQNQGQVSSLCNRDSMDCDDFDNELAAITVPPSLSTPAFGNRCGQESLPNKQCSKSFTTVSESVTLPRQQSFRVDNHIPYKNEKEKSVIVSKNCNDRQSVPKGSRGMPRAVGSAPNNENDSTDNKYGFFKTAKQEFDLQQAKSNKPQQKKTLGGKGSVNAQFVCPFKREKEKSEQASNAYDSEGNSSEADNELLKNIEPKMVELIKNEIMDSKTTVTWDDIAGLEYAKKIIKEVVVYPMLRPDIFTGLRRPPKGILLFGPPGTGKTLIGKCIASQSKATFFSISASSLTSKWIGEGEKMVRALFAVARVYQPSVVFVDEIDSLLTHRSETEHESSRRLKTEFLVQLDGAGTGDDDRILIVGATNRPQELDEAARRRLVKRLYVPLPELEARKQIINNLLVTIPHDLTEKDIFSIAQQSKGYSGADMTNLCKEASMGPIRSIPFSQLENIRTEDVRHVTINDFKEALIHVRTSVSESSLAAYVEWDSIYGTGTAQNHSVLS